MKAFSSNKFFLILSIFFILFRLILNGCLYKTEEGVNNEKDTDQDNFFEGITNETEKKQKCFSLSYSDYFQSKCCYSDNKCNRELADGSEEECPEYSIIYNNCGMAGILQPYTVDICTGISLVQGYCCFVKTKQYGNACIRTKNLNKDKNTATDQIIAYINKIKNETEIDSVECEGCYIKYYALLIIITVIFF